MGLGRSGTGKLDGRSTRVGERADFVVLSPPHMGSSERELLLAAFDSNWIAPVGPDLVAFCADRNPAKQNKLMAGSRIPVLAPECLDGRRPDYVLILPADQQPEIMAQLSPLRARGTQFVLAAPALTILA